MRVILQPSLLPRTAATGQHSSNERVEATCIQPFYCFSPYTSIWLLGDSLVRARIAEFDIGSIALCEIFPGGTPILVTAHRIPSHPLMDTFDSTRRTAE